MLWISFDHLGKVIGRVNVGELPNAGTNNFEIFAVFEDLKVGNDGDYTGGSLSLYRPKYCGSPIDFPFNMSIEYKTFEYEGNTSYFEKGCTYQGLYYDFKSYSTGDGSVILDTPGEWEAVITLFHVANETTKNVVGVVSFNVGDGNYSEEETNVELTNIIEQIYAALSRKLNIVSNTYVKVVDSIGTASLANYQIGDYILDRSTNILYKKDAENHVEFVIDFDISTTDFVTVNTEQVITGKKIFIGGAQDSDGNDFITKEVDDLENYYDKNTVEQKLNSKQNVLEFDDSPTPNSTNPVTSGGVYDSINNIKNEVMSTYVVSYESNPAFNNQHDEITMPNSMTCVNGTVVNANDLKIGDIIFVTEANVPDRWVGLINNGVVILNKMETSKVNLNNYYDKQQIDGFLDNKLDKSTTSLSVYGVNESGLQTNYLLDTALELKAIPTRANDGSVAVPLEPTRDTDASSKKYIDEKTVSLTYNETMNILDPKEN